MILKSKKSRIITTISTIVIISAVSAAIVKRANQPVVEIKNIEKFQEFRKSNEFQNMDRNQKRQVAGKFFMQEIDKAADTYSRLPEDQKERYIRDLVKEMDQKREEMQKTRAENDSPNRAKDGKEEQGRKRGGGGFKDPSRMRSRSENRSPESRAKMTQLFDAIRKERESSGSNKK